MSLKPTDQPVAYSNAVRAVLAALVILGVVDLSGEQVAGVVVAVEAILGVFVWSAVTPVAKANARTAVKVADAKKAARNEALADVASLKPAGRIRKEAKK